MDLVLTLSPSSSEAERGFSQLKLIKTKIRSKLGQTALNHCMGIKMLAPGIKEYDPLPAINYWNNSGVRSRRPFHKDNMQTKSVLNLKLQTPSDAAKGLNDVAVVAESDPTTNEQVVEGSDSQYALEESAIFEDEKHYESASDSEYDSDLEEENVFSKLLSEEMRNC